MLFLFAVLLVMLSLFVSGCVNKSSKDLPIDYISGDFVIDMENPREVIGLGDYVFVAQVNKEIETDYRNVKELGNGKKVSMPYTIYSITVIDNIKGEIKINEPIEFEKQGGINFDKKSISLPECDSMLEEGEYYILIASAEPDGRLAQGGPTAAIKLKDKSKNEIISSQVYKDYQKYYKEEIKFERQRFKSKYEEH
jgi:hypothetical protein